MSSAALLASTRLVNSWPWWTRRPEMVYLLYGGSGWEGRSMMASPMKLSSPTSHHCSRTPCSYRYLTLQTSSSAHLRDAPQGPSTPRGDSPVVDARRAPGSNRWSRRARRPRRRSLRRAQSAFPFASSAELAREVGDLVRSRETWVAARSGIETVAASKCRSRPGTSRRAGAAAWVVADVPRP
jgi:hypothetical protein